MAVEFKDVLRVEATDAALDATIRERQLGFATDSHELKFKATGGTVYEYAAKGENVNYDVITVDGHLIIDADGDTIITDTGTDDLMFLQVKGSGLLELDFSTATGKVTVNGDEDDVDFIVNDTTGIQSLRVDGQLGGVGINKDPSGSTTRLQIEIEASGASLIQGYDDSSVKIFEVGDDVGGGFLSLFDTSGNTSAFLAGETDSDGSASQFTRNTSDTNINRDALILSHKTDGTAAASLAVSLVFQLQGADGTFNDLAAIRGTQTDAATGSEDGSLGFYTGKAAVLAERMIIDEDGCIGIGGSVEAGVRLRIFNSTAAAQLKLVTDSTLNAVQGFTTDADGTPVNARIGVDHSDNVLRINHGSSFDGANNGIEINSSGQIGIGKAATDPPTLTSIQSCSVAEADPESTNPRSSVDRFISNGSVAALPIPI